MYYNPIEDIFETTDKELLALINSINISLSDRLDDLEGITFKVAYYAEITTTSGQISKPLNATILLDQWSNGVDAILSGIYGGKPNFEDTEIDVSSFDISGNYQLNGSLPTNPTALIYYISIALKDFTQLSFDRIIEYVEFNFTENLLDYAKLNTDVFFNYMYNKFLYNTFPNIGTYISGAYNTSTNWRNVSFKVKEGELITYNTYATTNVYIVTFTDINDVIVSYVLSQVVAVSVLQTATIAVPTNAVNAIVTCYITGLSTANVRLQKNITTEVQELIRVNKVINVSPNFTLNYATYYVNTILQATNISKEGDTILIHEGTYNEYNLQIKDNVTVKGIGIVTINGSLPANTSTVILDNTSTIDIFYNYHIENLIVTAKNMRYPVHSDFGNGNSTKIIKKCKFIHYGNQEVWEYRTLNGSLSPDSPAETFRAVSAFGGGLMSGDYLQIIDTIFISNLRAFSIHNNTDLNLKNGACKADLMNCEFISKGIDFDGTILNYNASIVIQHLTSNTYDVININNSVSSGFIVNVIDSIDNKKTFFLKGSGNNFSEEIYNTVGAGKTLVDEISFSLNDLDNANVINNEIAFFLNTGAVNLSKGYAVKKNGSNSMSLMTNSDNINDFLGVLLEDCAINETAKVKKSGYILRTYLQNISLTVLNENDNISIKNDGTFEVSNNFVVFKATKNQNLEFIQDFAGGIQLGDDNDVASATKGGTLRYRISGNNSYCDMCMQTGVATYEWVNIVQNNW